MYRGSGCDIFFGEISVIDHNAKFW